MISSLNLSNLKSLSSRSFSLNMTDSSENTMVSYDIQTYLLDKSNIQDTVTRMVSALFL